MGRPDERRQDDRGDAEHAEHRRRDAQAGEHRAAVVRCAVRPRSSGESAPLARRRAVLISRRPGQSGASGRMVHGELRYRPRLRRPGARPQDDLFGHVNGRWLADYEIPADRATDGAFRTLFDRAEEQVRDLITEAPHRTLRRTPTSSASATCMRASWTSDTVARVGLAPLHDELTPIDEAADAPSAGRGDRPPAAHRGRRRRRRLRRHRLQGLHPLSAAREPVRARPARRVVLPRRRSTPRSWPPIRATSRRCSLWCTAEPRRHADTAARIVALETKLAAAHWDVVKRRDADLTYNLRDVRRSARRGAGLRLVRMGDARWAVHADAAAEVVVRQPDYLTAFAALWAGEDIEDWKRLAALAGDPRSRVPAHRRSGRRGLRVLRPHADAAPSRSATAGSAASRWSRT